MYNLSLFFFFSSRMFEPTFSLFRHFVYLDLSRNLVPRSSHLLRLSRHFEYISILVGNFGHVILLCARVFSRAAAILKSEKTLGTRLVFIQSVAASRLRLGLEPRFRSLASQGCSKWRSTSFVMKGETASTCSGSSSDYQNKCLNQIIRMLMLRYPVVLDAGNSIQEPQASSSHFRRLTSNMRRIGISNIKEQDEQVKIEGNTKRSIFV